MSDLLDSIVSIWCRSADFGSTTNAVLVRKAASAANISALASATMRTLPIRTNKAGFISLTKGHSLLRFGSASKQRCAASNADETHAEVPSRQRSPRRRNRCMATLHTNATISRELGSLERISGGGELAFLYCASKLHWSSLNSEVPGEPVVQQNSRRAIRVEDWPKNTSFHLRRRTATSERRSIVLQRDRGFGERA